MDQRLSPDPDELLRSTVLDVLSANGLYRAALRVGVLYGVVHLAGSVSSLAMRRTAEALARSVPGVRGVVNRIDAPGAPSPTRIINLDLGRVSRKIKIKNSKV